MIIFINGASHAGKSTVAHLLAQKIPKSIVVEIDTLVHASKNPHPFLRIQEAMKSSIVLINQNLSKGHSIIVPFPLSLEHYTFFCKNVRVPGTSKQFYFFTLSPSIESVFVSHSNRLLTSKEREHIRHFYRLSLHQPSFGITIDNSNQSPQETTKILVDIINRTDQT